MHLSWGKKKTDIIRYIIAGVLLVAGFILTWGGGPEIKAFYLIMTFMAVTTFTLSGKANKFQDIILPLYAFLFGSYVDHVLSLYNNSFLQMFGTKSVTIYTFFMHGLAGYEVEFFLIIGLYFLLRALCTPSRIAALIAPVPTMLLSLTDYFVLRFRGTELSPSDILGAKTAMNVIGGYKFPVMEPFVLMYAPVILYVISLIFIKLPVADTKVSTKNRLKLSGIFLGATVISCLLLVVSVNATSRTTKTEYLSNNPSRLNGYITNFALQIKDLNMKAPEGYHKEDFAALYRHPEVSSSDVNIIVIMNESLADMSIYKDLTGPCEDTLPFIRSASDNPNVRAGYAYASVFGGNTCNSEFEFLTGISTAGLPSGAVPYSMYLNKPLYSLPRYLSDLGYNTTALHPYFSSSWNRTTAYPNLGFDQMKFMNDFTYDDSDIIRGSLNISENAGFMSDECAYRNIINMAESSSGPNFYFLVTIQNHGGYSPEQEKFDITNYVSGTVNDPELNSYLTNANRSDKALAMLLDELSASDKKYVVLIYGDHQPSLEVLQQENDDTSPNARKWLVPYVLWTNYDMPSSLKEMPADTSINYLPLDVLTAAGLPYSLYFETISEIRTSIPIINSSGYYSNATNSWHTLEDNEGSLNRYYALQYYSLFDYELKEE